MQAWIAALTNGYGDGENKSISVWDGQEMAIEWLFCREGRVTSALSGPAFTLYFCEALVFSLTRVTKHTRISAPSKRVEKF